MATPQENAAKVAQLLQEGKVDEANKLAKEMAGVPAITPADEAAAAALPPPRPEPELFELLLREIVRVLGNHPRLQSLIDEIDRGREMKKSPAPTKK